MKKHNFLALLIITIVLTAVSKVKAETNNSNSSGLSTTSYNGARNSLWDSNPSKPVVKPIVVPVAVPVVAPAVESVVTPIEVEEQCACPGDSDCPVIEPVEVVKPAEVVKPTKPKYTKSKTKAPRARG